MTKIAINLQAYVLEISGNEIEIDTDKLAAHADVCEYIFRHGIKQMLGDAYSTHKGTEAEKLAKAMKKLDSLYEGKAVQERGGSDPVKAEMRDMAMADLKAKIKAAGKKFADFDKENVAKALAKLLEANDAAYRKAAEAKLAIKPAKIEADDVMDLLG